MQILFKDVVREVLRHVMFEDAYPDRNPQRKLPWLREVLISAAREFEFDPIVDRLRRDLEYSKVLIDAVSSPTIFIVLSDILLVGRNTIQSIP